MGVKSKAASAIVILLVLLGSLWIHGGLDSRWDACLKGYNQVNQPARQPANGSSSRGPADRCPGQTFQVSRLLSHLLASPTSTADVLLRPYLSSWDELVKFMEALGPMVGLISKEIETKTSIIRELALLAEANPEAEVNPDGKSDKTVNPETREKPQDPWQRSGAYHSVRSMIRTELKRGSVDFRRQTDSGCRTLLRLHRALLWLKLFLDKLAEIPAAGRLGSPSELCREAYEVTLANHHSWLVRRAAEVAFLAMPERGFFFRLLCVQSQEELSAVLGPVVRAIGVVYDRTQKALEDNGMLDLP
ncbi:glycolipid transfer protein domain-containing protein 2 [Syngnathoides biaculeatus]|uniref:glycolipid transfer protein domain-containing protein 2 n=1 Tax=Syngnathoides biaculeatus TaxID=300417 RepID=UPI002ADE8A76|nr:glycolipid transfer protein domain-containing protein 2 [Syngnathoides biaculeatus]